MKRKAPEKKCPACNEFNHARRSKCKSCEHQFYVKKKERQEKLAADWRDLEAGDVIKCISGSGPYFLSRDKPGEKIMIGEKGKFMVVEIYDGGPKSCGIIGRKLLPRGATSGYREYIYMGEPHYDEAMNNQYDPHKIIVIERSSQKV